ncbi:MAG: NPCBM/NEW2 domain-containing protein [Acetobacteraceae bacterium]|nr:NPCBM/NEW2 domain-containing protein [Acetobacteraceae bacterium]
MKRFVMRRFALVGIVCLLVSALGSLVLAQQTQRQIGVAFLPLRYVIAGVDRTPPGGMIDTGVSKVPAGFVYQGTTYVPLRFISEALDQEVVWDGRTYTIYIGPRGLAKVDRPLKEVPLWSGPLAGKSGDWKVNRDRAALETEMESSTKDWKDIQSVTFNLNGLATSVSGAFYLREGWGGFEVEGGVVFTILGDGKPLHTSGVLMHGSDPVSFTADTRGVLQLTIRAEAQEAPDPYHARPSGLGGIVGIANLVALTTDY